MVIAECEQQRQAFRDTMKKFGLTLVDCISPSAIKDQKLDIATIEADIWLVDSQYDDDLYERLNTLKNRLMLVGFEQAPSINETNLYAKWQRKLKRKLTSMLKLPSFTVNKAPQKRYKPWRYVVLLGAGQKDTPAVQSFLDNLPSDLPVAVLLAQQTDSQQVHALPSLVSDNNEWVSQVISLSLNMQAGHCYVAPPDQKVVYDSTGRAIVTQENWLGEQTPNIQEVLENCSDAFGEQLISILFSDVEMDSQLNIAKVKDNNSQLWQQTSDYSVGYLSDAYGDELAQFSGSPKALVEHLTDYVNQLEMS